MYGAGIGFPFLAGIIIKSFFLPIQILATYYLIYYQIPTLLFPKKYLRFAISFFLSVLVFCTLAHLVEDLAMSKIVIGYTSELHTFWEIVRNPFANVGYSAEDIYPTVFIVSAMKFIKQGFEEKNEIRHLGTRKNKCRNQIIESPN